jgi:ATP synthase protein I
MADEGQGGKKNSESLRDLVTAEAMLQMAIALPLGCLIGWFGGDLLDRHFHTGWMAIVGILLGAAGGFLSLITTAQKYLKKGGQ